MPFSGSEEEEYDRVGGKGSDQGGFAGSVEEQSDADQDLDGWNGVAECGDEIVLLVVLPARPNRYEPRVKKRRPKTTS